MSRRGHHPESAAARGGASLAAEGQVLQVLVAVSAPTCRNALRQVLRQIGIEPLVSSLVSDTMRLLSSRRIVLAFCGTRFVDGSAQELLGKLGTIACKVPVVVASPVVDWDEYVGVLRLGAFDFISPPYRADDIVQIARYAFRRFAGTCHSLHIKAA